MTRGRAGVNTMQSGQRFMCLRIIQRDSAQHGNTNHQRKKQNRRVDQRFGRNPQASLYIFLCELCHLCLN